MKPKGNIVHPTRATTNGQFESTANGNSKGGQMIHEVMKLELMALLQGQSGGWNSNEKMAEEILQVLGRHLRASEQEMCLGYNEPCPYKVMIAHCDKPRLPCEK